MKPKRIERIDLNKKQSEQMMQRGAKGGHNYDMPIDALYEMFMWMSDSSIFNLSFIFLFNKYYFLILLSI